MKSSLKPGKSVKKKKNFKRFKHDIARIVVEGRNTDDLQNVVEVDDNSHLLRAICLFLVTLLRVTFPRVIAWQEMKK